MGGICICWGRSAPGFGLSFTAIGLIVGAFGIGGLVYAACVQQLVELFGQAGLAIFGGVLLAVAYTLLAIGTAWWLAPLPSPRSGSAYYALHNTLQTNATQMTPAGTRDRGRDLLLGDLSRSDAWRCGRRAGFRSSLPAPLFVSTAVILPALALWFARGLRRRR